ncbi:unnamed protein product, partial [Ixodes persulcatus]
KRYLFPHFHLDFNCRSFRVRRRIRAHRIRCTLLHGADCFRIRARSRRSRRTAVAAVAAVAGVAGVAFVAGVAGVAAVAAV